MADEKCVIDILDYRQVRIVFTEKKWMFKCQTHPELKSQTFLKNVERTLQEPEEVWEDYDDPKHKYCYYRKYSTNTMVKVVVWMDGDNHIVTAYETDFIKETKYQPDLKQVYKKL